MFKGFILFPADSVCHVCSSIISLGQVDFYQLQTWSGLTLDGLHHLELLFIFKPFSARPLCTGWRISGSVAPSDCPSQSLKLQIHFEELGAGKRSEFITKTEIKKDGAPGMKKEADPEVWKTCNIALSTRGLAPKSFDFQLKNAKTVVFMVKMRNQMVNLKISRYLIWFSILKSYTGCLWLQKSKMANRK